jgi:hypothetical protein
VALASWSGRSYEDVLAHASKTCQQPHRRGMYDTEVVRTARRMGVRLRKKRNCNFRTDEGILVLHAQDKAKKKRPFDSHYVFVSGGIIYDGTEIWEPRDYFNHYRRFKKGPILVKR